MAFKNDNLQDKLNHYRARTHIYSNCLSILFSLFSFFFFDYIKFIVNCQQIKNKNQIYYTLVIVSRYRIGLGTTYALREITLFYLYNNAKNNIKIGTFFANNNKLSDMGYLELKAFNQPKKAHSEINHICK